MGMGDPIGDSVAKQDANRFLVGLVVMMLVFALLLPLTALTYIDTLAIRATIRAEAKELRKLKEELKSKKEKENE
jgi:cell division protein FtsB